MRLLLHLVLIFVSAGFCSAQENNSGDARLRDALRQMTARVQSAEADAATAKAVQTDLEAKNKALAAQIEKLTKDLASEKTSTEKAASAAASKLAELEADLARAKEALDKWKAGHAQVSELARKAETARVALAAKAVSLNQQVADLQRKNLALYQLGTEILARLEGFGYGTALAAREPFVGTTRVKLENEVQGYKDKLLDPKLKP